MQEKSYTKLTPFKAIRAKCLQCSNGSVIEVKECPIKGCALYPYRLGHKPDKEQVTDVKVVIVN